jgi:RND superfamily putative drug exporter
MFVAVEVALAILAWGAYYEVISVFDGLKLYVTVIVYGAGIDYSLFLLARQEEALRDGQSIPHAVSLSLASVGTAIAASAGTEIVGIGLLATAHFGKFRQAGLGIALGLAVILVASLTLTPATVCLTRRWTFWPQEIAPQRPMRRFSLDWISARLWGTLGEKQRRYPGTILFTALGVMAPMAMLGMAKLDNLNYGIISGLPKGSLGVRGTEVLRKHFGPGITGPITLLLRNDQFDFRSHEGIRQIADLSARLRRRSEQLGIADVRSLSDPLGHSEGAQEIIADLAAPFPVQTFLDRGELVVTDTAGTPVAESLLQETIRELAYEQYVSHATSCDGTVTRLILVPKGDPLRRESVQEIGPVERTIREILPQEIAGSEVYLLGATASLRDIRDVTRSDWAWVRVVVPVGVFLVLLLLLRKPLVLAYLVLTVIFSFLVTYGITYVVFWAFDPSTFPGLNWTVPALLFTLLVAVGEDYSVLLVSRTEEERRGHGPTRSVSEALTKTGGLISGAGLIMAGTFSALAIGETMANMLQLGFALCFGVLLDRFIVRPLLVPSFLDLQRKRFLRQTSHTRLPAGRSARLRSRSRALSPPVSAGRHGIADRG